jgi:hypothetical protein
VWENSVLGQRDPLFQWEESAYFWSVISAPFHINHITSSQESGMNILAEVAS